MYKCGKVNGVVSAHTHGGGVACGKNCVQTFASYRSIEIAPAGEAEKIARENSISGLLTFGGKAARFLQHQ